MTNAVDSTRLVTFRIGEHLFGAEIQSVQRVLRYETPRALPDMPEWMEGVVDYQGAMVPVIDMRRRFGIVATPPGAQARLMVCNSPGGLAALLVDAVLDVKPVQGGDLMDPPALFRGLAGEYLKGLTRRQVQGTTVTDRRGYPRESGDPVAQLVVVLDVERLLASQAPLHFLPDAAGA
jgi:purine-binding chemotaxis protein CheW